ncbi:MAG: hemerythrin family protein [Campylobacteraceae bacterium]|nr:hemerythrin family protein [Campylobacteraceae bacterium]
MITDWSESFSLYHEAIDNQHKELFRLAEIVRNLDAKTTTKAELGVLFKEFFNYMREHFSDEETYMKSIDYPLFPQHQKLHQEIIASMIKTLKEAKTASELQENIKFLSREWLVNHILGNDLKIEKWRKGNTISVEDISSSKPI